jgi:hypothetical protein
MSIGGQEDQLFAEWSKGRTSFFKDGVVDEGRFMASSIRTAFLLKEPNSRETSGDLRKYFRAPDLATTANNLARWAYGILNIEKEVPWEEVRKVTFERRKEWLTPACIINVKKSAGTGNAPYSEVQNAMRMDAKFLLKQMSIYHDFLDVVIACGHPTECLSLTTSPTWKHTSHGARYYEFAPTKFLLAWYHPQARYPSNLLFYGLVEAVKEFRRGRSATER